MSNYNFPKMYFHCDDRDIQRQVERIVKGELEAGKNVSFEGKPYYDYEELMDAVKKYATSLTE